VRAVGPKLVARFSCLADRCEDTCCQLWKIPIDEAHYHAMEAQLAPDVFALAVKKVGDPYARMVLGDDGFCRFLDDGLCSLHRQYGTAILPDACASYPRIGSLLGDLLEANLELSCPEATRLCLLGDDALEMEEIDPARAGRAERRQVLSEEAQAKHPELREFSATRAQVLSLLQKREYPLRSRLFFIAVLAERPELIEHLPQLHQQIENAPQDASLAATILVAILGARLASAVPRKFRSLVDDVLARDLREVGHVATGDTAADLKTLGGRKLLSLHRARPLADIDAYLERYCRHFFYGDWYLRSPSLLVHLNSLLIRLSAIRWLVQAHPLSRDNLPQAVVEVVYSLSRAVEHSDELAQTIRRALVETGTTTVAHAAALLKF
jgi:lysine-N-methylase